MASPRQRRGEAQRDAPESPACERRSRPSHGRHRGELSILAMPSADARPYLRGVRALDGRMDRARTSKAVSGVPESPD